MPETAPATTPESTRRRERAVRLTVAASVGAKIVSVLCTLAQVPLALHSLGTEGYGLWITLFGVMVMLNLADFGLGIGMQKTMAEAFGRDDPARLLRAFLSGAMALGLLALAIMAIGVPLALVLDWADILHLREPGLRAQTGPALALTLGAFALGLPLNAASRLAAAAQRGWVHAGWIAAGSVGTLGLVIWASYAQWGFLPFVAATMLLPAAQNFGLTVHLWRSLGWRIDGIALLPRAEWRARLRESLSFAAPQIALAAAQSAPPLALMVVAGPTAATAFNILQRLFSPIAQGQIMFLTPLWPAYTEAQVRGDTPWVRRAFRQSIGVALGAAGAVALLTWQVDPVLRWWLGPGTHLPGQNFGWLVAGWIVAQLFWQPPLYLLMGIGRPTDLARWGTLGPVLALTGIAASGFFGLGANGVLLGASLGLAALGLPGLLTTAWTKLRNQQDGSGPQ